jgi:hypothetical protein
MGFPCRPGGLAAVMGRMEFVVELGILSLDFQQPGPVEQGGAGVVVGFKERRLDLTADASGGGQRKRPPHHGYVRGLLKPIARSDENCDDRTSCCAGVREFAVDATSRRMGRWRSAPYSRSHASFHPGDRQRRAPLGSTTRMSTIAPPQLGPTALSHPLSGWPGGWWRIGDRRSRFARPLGEFQ